MSTNPNSQDHFEIRWSTAIFFFVYTLLVRLAPYILYRMGMPLSPDVDYYPWNFSPAFAVCLFTGAFCTNRKVSFALPLVTFLLSDIGIWMLTGRADWAFYPAQYSIYLSLIACTALGYFIRKRCNVTTVALTGFSSCVLFFVFTNFAVWAASQTYAKSLGGLLECYVAAIPFFRNSVLGTIVFSALLFSPLCLRRSEQNLKEQLVVGQAG